MVYIINDIIEKEVQMYKIVFCQDKNGRREVEEYLKRISSSKQLNDKRVAGKLRYQLELLELLGPQIEYPQARFLRGLKYPIWELRPLPERVFFIAWQKDNFVLLSHYTKDQNKTDIKQLNHAIRLADDWFERFGR